MPKKIQSLEVRSICYTVVTKTWNKISKIAGLSICLKLSWQFKCSHHPLQSQMLISNTTATCLHSVIFHTSFLLALRFKSHQDSIVDRPRALSYPSAECKNLPPKTISYISWKKTICYIFSHFRIRVNLVYSSNPLKNLPHAWIKKKTFQRKVISYASFKKTIFYTSTKS